MVSVQGKSKFGIPCPAWPAHFPLAPMVPAPVGLPAPVAPSGSLHRLCGGLGFRPSDDEARGFAQAIGDWPAFHDTAPALRRLQTRFRLGVITNCDRDLFALSNRRLGVVFDWVATAEEARAYKPSHAPFELAFATIDVARDRILHAAQSLFHDHVPGKQLGLTTAWVDRRHDRPGFGATPAASATPDLTVPDMATLAGIALG